MKCVSKKIKYSVLYVDSEFQCRYVSVGRGYQTKEGTMREGKRF